MPQRHLFAIKDLVGDRLPKEIATDLDVSTRTVQRWIHHGVNWRQADVFACKFLNAHPLCVFGPEWHDVADDTAYSPSE